VLNCRLVCNMSAIPGSDRCHTFLASIGRRCRVDRRAVHASCVHRGSSHCVAGRRHSWLPPQPQRRSHACRKELEMPHDELLKLFMPPARAHGQMAQQKNAKPPPKPQQKPSDRESDPAVQRARDLNQYAINIIEDIYKDYQGRSCNGKRRSTRFWPLSPSPTAGATRHLRRSRKSARRMPLRPLAARRHQQGLRPDARRRADQKRGGLRT
jgi:hypothetical protein